MSNRKYDDEFKQEAVRMVVEEGRGVRSVEKSLGITYGVLKGWVGSYRQQRTDAANPEFPSEIKVGQLEKELARVTRERYILKKAVAIFSKDPNPYSGS
ncbi:MAG: transposase [Spirochaetota bacterium]